MFWSRFPNCGLMSPLGGGCNVASTTVYIPQPHVVARVVEWLFMASNVAFRSAPFKFSCNPHQLIGCSIHSNFHVSQSLPPLAMALWCAFQPPPLTGWILPVFAMLRLSWRICAAWPNCGYGISTYRRHYSFDYC